jgi:hypothetical protein
MKKKGIRVPGIGHRIKSKDNRDKRVELLQNYARRCAAILLGVVSMLLHDSMLCRAGLPTQCPPSLNIAASLCRFFPSTKYLDYALTVERYTLQKAANLVMNVRCVLCIGCRLFMWFDPRNVHILLLLPAIPARHCRWTVALGLCFWICCTRRRCSPRC